MNQNLVLNDLLNLEKEVDIYNERIWGLPIWAFCRRKFRNRYMFINADIQPMTINVDKKIGTIFLSFLFSSYHIIKLFLFTKNKSNLFIGFPRLEKIEDKYMDRFIDPILELSDIKNDYVYLERGINGFHYSPRYLNDVFWSDSIDIISLFLSMFITPFLFVLKCNIYIRFFRKLNKLMPISTKDRIKTCCSITSGLLKTYFYCLLIKRLKIKRCFMPAAVVYYSNIAACKKAKIPIFEIQHGITVGKTTTYSGEYIPICYPDYFLAFGNSSMKDGLFGIPLNHMKNIGCAFKEYLKNIKVEMFKNTYLFLSDPEITQKIVLTMVELAKTYPNYYFHLRLHPQEKLNKEQQTLLSRYNNVKVVESKINSIIACMSYDGVIAENTSVLYEAVSIGIKAARIQYNGLQTIHYEDEPENLFYYMKSPNDFRSFSESFELRISNKELFYSYFDVNEFNSLLRK